MRDQWRDGKDQEEQRGERNRGSELVAGINLKIPADVEQQSTDVTQDQQPSPRLARDHCYGCNVQQCKIGEQLEFVVLPG